MLLFAHLPLDQHAFFVFLLVCLPSPLAIAQVILAYVPPRASPLLPLLLPLLRLRRPLRLKPLKLVPLVPLAVFNLLWIRALLTMMSQ
jgi:hypothetical protein